MRYLLSFILLAGICFSSCKEKQEDMLAGIKKKRDEINNALPKLTKKQVEDLTSRTGGAITGYYRDEEVRKISAEYFGARSRIFTEYYFDEGMLIFIIKQEYVYNRRQTYNEDSAKLNNDSEWYDDKKTKLQINRFFFHNNKLIKWLDEANVDIPINKIEFINKESGLLGETIILVKQLKEE